MRDAPKHPSPNSGWGEAATASILGIQLGGVNYYKGSISDRARMGAPVISLKSIHIQKSITLMQRASFGFMLLLWIGGISLEMALSWI
ncbi:cobalamin biosynthesis protein [Bacillus sp. CECT 9360]|uniref:cobalamin biosynthesis protein n=1 Tax=Bacillus sp. CECT 9360 TaxID=2845821 RepID=UPI0033AADC4C